MIPHLLTIEGLYAYRESVTIDFAPLLDAHLFGIFGAVGSGKSSILEAITYALFGKVERLNLRENMAANMINLDATRARIEFTFESQVDRNLYLVRVIGKRTPKAADWKREFFRIQEDVIIPIEEAAILEAVGLSYDHFIRTVIVPQGRFQAFLMLSDKDRTDMLQDLFHLNRFDLGPKLGRIKGKCLGEEQFLSGQIESLKTTPIIPDDELTSALLHFQKEAKLAQEHALTLEQKSALVSQWLHIDEQLVTEKNQLVSTSAMLTANQERLVALETTYQELNEQWLLVPQNKDQIAFAEKALQIKSITTSIKTLTDTSTHNEALLKPIRLERDLIKSELGRIADQNEQLFELKASPELIRARQQLLDQLIRFSVDQAQRKQRGQAIALDKDNQIKQLREQMLTAAAKAGISIPSVKELYSVLVSKHTELKLEIASMEKVMEDLQQKGGLDRLAEALQPGQPCPLCGSLSHPLVHHPKAIIHQLTEVKLLLNKQREQERILIQCTQQIEQEPSVVAGFDKELNRLRSDYRNAEEKNKKDIELIQSWGMDLESLEAWLNDQGTLDLSIQNLQKENQTKSEKLEQIQKKYELLQLQIQEASHLLVTSSVQKQTLLEQIPAHLHPKLFESEEAHLRTFIKAESLRLVELSHQYQKSSAERESQMQLVQEKLALVARFNTQITLLNSKMETVLADISNSIPEWPKDPNTIEVKKQLTIWSEERKASLTSYTAYMSELRLLQEAKSRQELQKTRLAELAGEHRKVQLKLDNLRTLEGLFRGKGMVEFAASRYLSQIIERANGRFYKMTRHKLRMELGEGNRIMVRDYYHGGAMRLVKTLSGGQIFQASLALALSLADQIRTYKEGQRDFFFLDEGFGSQDKESLRIVLETLKALRTENRCVGIISHVEELKQEVGAYLTVHLDPIRGSQITTNT
ncbi:MAG: SMC family ATPase [Saprospiraceae bacterium]|nr:SMC family ATPase [Saprospiraceae bacterium]